MSKTIKLSQSDIDAVSGGLSFADIKNQLSSYVPKNIDEKLKASADWVSSISTGVSSSFTDFIHSNNTVVTTAKKAYGWGKEKLDDAIQAFCPN